MVMTGGQGMMVSKRMVKMRYMGSVSLSGARPTRVFKGCGLTKQLEPGGSIEERPRVLSIPV